ncbi:polymorphic outer membrane protein middle domain-containing protein [Chlamydia sp. 17-3921]|uniref:polymorphic outer membrane protein middle domain-containing protein n=1 Tax=Chlamydia sp. 17-3921 TaxID=2675798 RepID=UPI001918D23D|nr:polymorphic outer membrane protein middle domain-containing protein [Chlamydia sp. 17-3921]
MRRPFHWFLVSSALSLSSWSLFAVDLSTGFEGSASGEPDFPSKKTTDAEGTTYTLTSDVIFKNIPPQTGHTAAKTCFSNTAGKLTFVGAGFSLIFESVNLMGCHGAAISNDTSTSTESPTQATPLTFSGFSTLSFIKSPSSEAAAGLGMGAVFVANRADGDAIFSENAFVTFKSNSNTEKGGAICSHTLNMSKTKNKLTFEDNKAKTGGAVYVSGGKLSLSENTSVVFSSNKSSNKAVSTATSEPSDTPTSDTSSTDTSNTEVSQPSSSPEGTASVVTMLHRKAMFLDWRSISATGDTTVVEKATEETEVADTTTPPNLDGCGGALCCYEENTTENTTDKTQTGVVLSKNQSITFDNNSATASGGAIYGTKFSATENGTITFSNNTATTSGGAIYVKDCTISAGGTTTFLKNSASQGGAIAIANGGTLTLSAIGGDIIFEGNTIKTADGTIVPNAIHLGDNSTMTLQADHGHTIYFYDPITIAKSTTTEIAPKIIINAPTPIVPAEANSVTPVVNASILFDSASSSILPYMSASTTGTETPHTGTIVFSGEKLTEELLKNPTGATSNLEQDVELKNGSLVIKDGAGLSVKSLKQNPDSIILMDTGTTLETTSTDGGNLEITNLSVNIDTINPTSKPIKIAVNNSSGKLTLTGSLKYHNNMGSYENPALGHDFSIPIFDLSAGTGGSVDVSGFSMTPSGDLPSSSGYQGQWVLVPTVTSEGKTVLTAKWESAGYIPLPERHAFLVPNSLWNITQDTLAIQNIIATNINNAAPNNIWIAGTSNFFHRNRKASVGSGFRHIVGGYVIGGGIDIPSGNIMGIAVSQLFGKSKDYSISDIKSRVYSGTFYAQHTQSVTLPEFLRNHAFSRVLPLFPKETLVIMKAHVTYARANNDMETRYVNAQHGKSTWDNHCIAFESSNYMPIKADNHYITYSPFVKLQFVYANQIGFEEVAEATNIRNFSSSHLIKLSLPIGIMLEKHTESSPHAFDLTLIYNADLYRDTPECHTSMPATGVSWMTFATNLARQGFQAQVSSHHRLGRHLEVSICGGAEIRSSSRSYNADCKARYFF